MPPDHSQPDITATEDDEGSKSSLQLVGSNHILLITMFLVATYMFIDSFSFPESAARFPQFTTAVVIIGTILLLIQSYLPEPLRRLVAEPIQAFTNELEEEQEIEEAPNEASPRRLNPTNFAILAILGYCVLSYLIGMLWATPIFVLVYTRWFQLSWLITALLTVLTTIIAYGFMILLYLPLDEGILLPLIEVVS